ncbi:GNAT family N-acetyltransferase [Hyphococcus flavus]|uniref:GNAT family N-acetyltransferase n=1 Tax=Hyphococcus flavus TaxID=1866326 RepID=A0AAE9ZBQ1_9PROT|nr:GNAT family N-acetyltransferase [Hyphococcus flavus]WDI31748.1 GNAT family N-acetyltransferase [Hyphococcus flavus]
MSNIRFRPATVDDARGINAVYNPFIRESTVTFETVEHTADQRKNWLVEREGDPRYPVIVAEDEDAQICGFSSASPFDQRAGYATSVKTSIFVDPGSHGKKIGRGLYATLFQALESTDLHRAYGLVAAPNPASAALHQQFGFVHISTLNQVGRKFGRFIDVMWFEKRL